MVYARQIYKQQASNTAIEGSRERRYFEAVKGVKGHEGELWGLANLFKLTAETVATRDIITATDRRELNYSIKEFDADNAGEHALGSTDTPFVWTCKCRGILTNAMSTLDQTATHLYTDLFIALKHIKGLPSVDRL